MVAWIGWLRVKGDALRVNILFNVCIFFERCRIEGKAGNCDRCSQRVLLLLLVEFGSFSLSAKKCVVQPFRVMFHEVFKRVNFVYND